MSIPTRAELQRKIKKLEAELQFANLCRSAMGQNLAEVRRIADSYIVRDPATAKLLGVKGFYGASGATTLLGAGFQVLQKALQGQYRQKKPQLTKGERTWLLHLMSGKKKA